MPTRILPHRPRACAQAPSGSTHAVQDLLFRSVTRFFAFLVLSCCSAIIVSLVAAACRRSEKFGFGFLVEPEWDPVTEKFGALVPIYGTLVTSAIAMLIGVPVSFGIALFLTELSPAWLKRPLGTAIELLAAIPSIIYGMWGLFVFAPLFADYVQPVLISTLGARSAASARCSRGRRMGIGMLTAGIILAIMVIPFITAVMRDVFEIVPPMLKESAYGLGATTWEVVWHVVLPYTKVGVIGGIMLGLGPRARRDDGGDVRDRQRAPPDASLLAPGQQHRVGARQRVHRGGRRPVLRRR